MSDFPASLPLTLNGETREVEVEPVMPGKTDRLRTKDDVALYQKNGGKLWAWGVTFHRQADGSYKPSLHGTFLNRPGYVARYWNDETFARYRSQHNTIGQAA